MSASDPLPASKRPFRRQRPTSAPASASPAIGRGSDPRRALGRLGEDLAAANFTRLGFRCLERNARTRHGEIDLVVFDGRTLVFAEVKTRRVSAQRGSIRPDQDPLTWLRRRQRLRLRRLATAWLADEGRVRPTARSIRFDAVGVIVTRDGKLLDLRHIEGAW